MNKKQSANLNQVSKENSLFIGNDYNNNPIFVDMNQNPHILITGVIRTGKSKLLQGIIADLINNNENVELYLTQICKKDLFVFNDYKQVKYNAKTLVECNQLLKYLSLKIKEREEIVHSLILEGLGNSIADYNKINLNNKIPYIYIIIDDYDTLLENISDSRDNRELKKSIMKKINHILQIGRQMGCFIILSSITFQDLFNNKFGLSQICNKIVFRIDSSVHSRMLIDSSEAKDLGKGECILLSDGKKVKVKIEEIQIKDIVKQIEEYKEINHELIEIPTIKLAYRNR